MGKKFRLATEWKNIEFVEGKVSSNYATEYHLSLFNTQAHRSLQAKQGWIEFHLIRTDKKEILASIFFCLEGGIASSPTSAPFGSFELSESVSTEYLYEFIGFVELRLNRHGAKQIRIKNYPEAYHSRLHNLVTVLLFNHQYRIDNAELGACIHVDDDSLELKMDQWERRKLKQARKAGLSFKTLSVDKFNEVYDFILACREKRGQSLSMTKSQLKKVVIKFPSEFYLFGVYERKGLVAASISIRVSQDVVYNFYSAHARSSDHLSPVVFLISNLYYWAYGHKFKLIDLGTSALGGVPNFPLIDFKLRLGASPSMKLTFQKKLK
ncbi:MAG: hypothetical protein KDC99_03740 [Cyclobacteriaceae bacterium]|nr:hypothetical protein [Cyclobacteriaceae bacterium]